ncbi:MAG: response regulator [Desulfobacterales bacterium]|nr:response regulator [Desulfobacterales bacterium]
MRKSLRNGPLFPGLRSLFFILALGGISLVPGLCYAAGQEGFFYSPWMVLGLVLILLVLMIRQGRLRKRMVQLKASGKETRNGLRYFKIIAAHAREGIVIVRDFKITYANAKTFEMLGIKGSVPPSDKIMDYIHPEDMGPALEKFETLMFSDVPEPEFSIRLLGPEQEWIWGRLRMERIPMGSGHAILIYIQDITQVKDMEQELLHNQRMEAIAVLSGGIVHDFNNILTSIMGNAELGLLALPKGSKGRTEFREIHNSSLRARELVRQILNLSQNQKTDPFPMSLDPMVREGVKFLKSILPATVKITHHIQPEAGSVVADTSRLYQVFMNLCTNAKQAMEKTENAHLDIRVHRMSLESDDGQEMAGLAPGNYVVLSVSDNGSGVDPAIHGKIFDPYFTTQTNGRSSGLGLAASREIIREYQGELVLESSTETGSRFQVFLPVHCREQDEAYGVAGGNSLAQGQGNILFCDDEREITLLVRKMFESLGYNILTTSSGEEALEFLERDPDFFDLIITDLDMPGMSCENLITSIRQIRRKIPLVLCTGHSDVFDENQALEAGVMEYISKPYSLSALSAIASRYISPSP